VLFVAAAIAVGASGCGRGDEEPAAPAVSSAASAARAPEVVSPEDERAFGAAVAELCDAARARVAAAAAPTTPEGLRAWVDATVQAAEELRGGLEELVPPSRLAGDFGRLVAYLERDPWLARELLLAAEAENASLTLSLARDLETSRRAEDVLLARLGC
jgi:hypothetical protein